MDKKLTRPNGKTEAAELPRIGHLCYGNANFDNGLYTTGTISGIIVDFLVDSGSTASLISKKTFDKINEVQHVSLYQRNSKVQGVNGSSIKTYGYADVLISFGPTQTQHEVIICDITPDGVLGQDFVLKHIKTWDFDSLSMRTRQEKEIRCHFGGNENMSCRVTVQEEVEIPSNSYMFVPVELHNDTVSGIGFLGELDTCIEETGHVRIIPGVVDTSNIHGISIINDSEDKCTLFKGTSVGICTMACEQTEKLNITRASYSCNEHEENPTSYAMKVPVHLTDLYDRSSTHLNDDEKTSLAALLTKYQDVFSKAPEDLGQTDRVKHSIDTGTAKPIRQAPRRLPIGKRDTEKQEIDKMLERGVIEPSNSAWSSPIVLVTKKDGSTRFCVDYRSLNDVTVKDAYPLPRVDDCLDALSGAKWFSCMDLNSGFWQIALDERDKEKTSFATTQGLYQFKVMPFGLVNAPSTFQRLMEDVLRGIQWTESLLYMDDIITPGQSVQHSLTRLENVFKRLLENHLKFKPSKCVFFQKSVNVLGHTVSEAGIHTEISKIAAVKEWPEPKNTKEIRSFLGLASYYRKFVKGFADIARPLHKLSEKYAKFNWTNDCQEAFDRLKEALTTAPILAYPKVGCRFILDTDASDKAVGAVLSQEQDGHECVIAYMSKTMNKHEQTYCITRKELLAVVVALRNFHTYLYGQDILLRTDNAAVSWMRNLKIPTGQTARWLQELSTYNLAVTHRPGMKHTNADALSRKPCKVCTHQQDLQTSTTSDDEPSQTDCNSARAVTRSQAKSEVEKELTENQLILTGWTPSTIAEVQASDSNIEPILTQLSVNGSRPEWGTISEKCASLKTLWRQWDRLEVHAGMLYRRWIDPHQSNTFLQLVVPLTKREEVLHYYHDVPSAAHLGCDKMLDKVRQTFYWPGMSIDVKNYCRRCDKCTARKLSKGKNKAPLGQYHVGEPMERVALDILGPLPISNAGNRFILVMMDCFTKWTESVAIPNQEAATVADAFVNNFVSRFGTPLQLYTDQGRNFESNLFQEVCVLLDIDKTRTTSLRPQANGMVERFNRTLISMLSMYCNDNQKGWDKYIPQVMMAYRSSPHASTKISPNKMVFGREIVLPIQAYIGRPKLEDDEETEDYVGVLQQRLEEIHDLARDNLKQASEYQKKYYDTGAKKKKRYSSGQLVWLHDPTRKVGVCSKLINKWKGPYIVTRVLDDLICMVKRSRNQKPKAYHVDRLYHYQGRMVAEWLKRESKLLVQGEM
jgi:transposase InsO family protein